MTTTAPRAHTDDGPGALARLGEWLDRPAPAERLAALRIATGGFSLVYFLVVNGEFRRLANLPSADFEPVGVAHLLSTPLGGSALLVVYLATLVLGVAFVLGAGFRVTGPAYALGVLFLASYHSSFGQMLHFEHVFTLHLLVLAVSPAADAWAWPGRRPPGPPATRYGWPIRLLAIITVTTYALAGLAKLRYGGAGWLDGETLRNHIAWSTTRLDLLGAARPPLARALLDAGWLLTPLAIGSVLIELAAPLALASRRFRTGWAVAIIVMHTAIAATMLVWFPYQGLGFALLPLFAAERPFLRRG